MREDLTELLVEWSHGDQEALEKLMPLVYDELHRLAERYMGRERRDHTLQPTALVHEAYLRLIDQNRVQWQNRAHFFGVAARLMRRVTVRHARDLLASKRGGGRTRVLFDDASLTRSAFPSSLSVQAREEDLLALDEVLERLTSRDPRQGRIVELRFFGGLVGREVAEVLGVSRATVDREWRLARAWLKRELASV